MLLVAHLVAHNDDVNRRPLAPSWPAQAPAAEWLVVSVYPSSRSDAYANGDSSSRRIEAHGVDAAR